MRQNTVFSTKNTKNFLGRGHSPSPDLSPSGEGTPFSTPHPPRRLDPLHAEILGTPLVALYTVLVSHSACILDESVSLRVEVQLGVVTVDAKRLELVGQVLLKIVLRLTVQPRTHTHSSHRGGMC